MSNIMYYSPIKIQSEDDIVVFLANELKTDYQEVYPKVTKISRNIDVSPDIDLLVINSINDITIGYETKLIKYNKGNKNYTYNEIYKGIGQALLYRNFGIDKAYLIVGYYLNDEVPNNAKKKIIDKMNDVINTITNLFINKYLGFKVIEIFQDYIAYHDMVEISKQDSDSQAEIGAFAKRKTETFDFRKKCILKGQLSWSKPLGKKLLHYEKSSTHPRDW